MNDPRLSFVVGWRTFGKPPAHIINLDQKKSRPRPVNCTRKSYGVCGLSVKSYSDRRIDNMPRNLEYGYKIVDDRLLSETEVIALLGIDTTEHLVRLTNGKLDAKGKREGTRGLPFAPLGRRKVFMYHEVFWWIREQTEGGCQ